MSQRAEGMASLSLGSGPPLLFLPGLTPSHQPPHGSSRRFQLQQMRLFAEHRAVWWVNRRQGLPPDVSMAAVANDYAAMLREWGDAPIDVLGVSTGGSVALQLALDHPDLVRHLVLVAAGCRLGVGGQAAQRSVMDSLRSGDRRQAGATLMATAAAGPRTARVLGALGWLLPGAAVARGAEPDLLAVLQAEESLNLCGRLSVLTVPTLVVGGDRDAFYGEEVFRETVAALPNGRLVLYRDTGHLGTLRHHGLGRVVSDFLDNA